MVNAIPETVVLESYVRGASFDAIVKENKKVNQALCGAALSIDTNVEIIDLPGYAPLIYAEDFRQVAKEAANLAVPEYEFPLGQKISSGSTDMGDLCCVMPVLHPYAGGAAGKSHGSNYQIVDPEAACVGSAKMQLAMLQILLKDDAKRAKSIIENYEAPFASPAEYLAFMDSLARNGNRITYAEDGTAWVDIV